ncbi:integral membrane protein [Streptococcus pneumoniae]|nr:integral membrane protein [Streptococcus pneumoniae]
MIVSGEVSLIPFLGWVGGILAIIGGSLFLATLKKFKSEE